MMRIQEEEVADGRHWKVVIKSRREKNLDRFLLVAETPQFARVKIIK